jgi:hypothetical protein
MYFIEWLRNQVVIERETLPASTKTVSQAIQAAHIRSIEIKARLPTNGPDSFRILDGTGREIGVFQLRK